MGKSASWGRRGARGFVTSDDAAGSSVMPEGRVPDRSQCHHMTQNEGAEWQLLTTLAAGFQAKRARRETPKRGRRVQHDGHTHTRQLANCTV